MVHSCPRCELRFTTSAELQSHFAADHGGDPDTFDRLRYHAPPASAAGSQIVVVGNRTLPSSELWGQLSVLPRTVDVVVVVPLGGPDGSVDDSARELAVLRGEGLVARLHQEGFRARLTVHDGPPVDAVASVLDVDARPQILLSVHPDGMSRWLHTDVPTQLQRAFGVPTTVVTATSIAAPAAPERHEPAR